MTSNPDVLDLKRANLQGACAEKGHRIIDPWQDYSKGGRCCSCEALLSPRDATQALVTPPASVRLRAEAARVAAAIESGAPLAALNTNALVEFILAEDKWVK